MAATHIHDLALIVEDLERSGRLARVSSSVDLQHDLAGLAAELESGPRAVLFEKIAGHEWPVLTGLYWSRELLADLLRREERTLPQYVSDCIRQWQQAPVDPVVVPTGPVLDVTEPDIDLAKMPIPIHAQKDGGPYFDAAVVIAKDPETGVRNASIQRFQVVAKDRMHVNIDAGRHLELYLEKAEARGETLTFTLNCGVGPGLHFAAAAPAEAAPADSDELGIASAFHGAPLELVKASNGHDDMVAHAMWALECEMVPGEVADEGPFAEVTGYYATVAPRPVVHVRKIHRRAEPVFQTILSGVEVWNSVGLLGEANILQLLQKQVPGVTDVYMSHGGGGFYHCVVQLAQKRQGWSKQAILAAFSAFPPLKMVTIVDDDVDLRSAQDVEWAMATRLDPTKGIVTIDESFGHGLNPSFPDYLGPKVGFDATKPYPPTWAYERATYKPMSLEAVEMVQPDIVRRAAAPKREAPQAGASRAETEAFESALARPQPIDLTPVRADSAGGAAAASGDPDAWIARPAPIDLTPVRASGAAGAGRAAAADPDAWIVRPPAIDLGPGHAAGGAAGRTAGRQASTAAEDPDAWIARPAPADLGPRRASEAGRRTVAVEDADAWIARPAPADLTPAGASGAAAVRETPVAEEPADADAGIARPAPIDLGPARAEEA
ncbi:MAG: UbiD family decarboxylase, partial [Rhodospirillaceae bacterium]|nr:UbiD family decarboxylase [Rhodospirillaceae bacterium]